MSGLQVHLGQNFVIQYFLNMVYKFVHCLRQSRINNGYFICRWAEKFHLKIS